MDPLDMLGFLLLANWADTIAPQGSLPPSFDPFIPI
jgi:hypothetical protein